MTELQTVTFQAAKTNSAPEPKRRSSDGPFLIALFNAFGIAWILWDHHAIALVIAVCVFAVSYSMRRNFWAKGASLLASCAVAFALIVHPPTLQPNGYHRYRPQATEPIDPETIAVLCAVAVLMLWRVHEVAGEPDPISAAGPLPTAPKPPGDEEERIKRLAFDLWFADRITAVASDVTIAFAAVYADYKRAIAAHLIKPKSYDAADFKRVFKECSGREPIEIKSELVYQGVAFIKTDLI